LLYFSDIRKKLSDSDSDKENLHKYGFIFSNIINSLYLQQRRPLDILEIGVTAFGSNSSLSVWQSDHIFRKVVAIDDVEYKGKLDKKTEFIKGDAYQNSMLSLLKSKYLTFDIIIDDGSHKPHHQIFFLDNYDELLNPNGILICEDIENFDVIRRYRDTALIIDNWACAYKPDDPPIKDFRDPLTYDHHHRLIIKQKIVQDVGITYGKGH